MISKLGHSSSEGHSRTGGAWHTAPSGANRLDLPLERLLLVAARAIVPSGCVILVERYLGRPPWIGLSLLLAVPLAIWVGQLLDPTGFELRTLDGWMLVGFGASAALAVGVWVIHHWDFPLIWGMCMPIGSVLAAYLARMERRELATIRAAWEQERRAHLRGEAGERHAASRQSG